MLVIVRWIIVHLDWRPNAAITSACSLSGHFIWNIHRARTLRVMTMTICRDRCRFALQYRCLLPFIPSLIKIYYMKGAGYG